MAFFQQIIFFFCILPAECSERKLEMNHFKRTEVLQMIGSRTIPVGFQLETMSYHTFRAFVMIVICQVGLKQTMAFVVDEKLNAALIFNLHFCGFYNIAQ